MKLSLYATCFAALILQSVPALSQTPEQKGYQIAKQAADKDIGYRDYTASGNMVLRARNGKTSSRDFDFKSIEGQHSAGDKTIIVFNWPGDIRDTALLTHAFAAKDDNQWLYLPARRRVKRISSRSRSGSFVGSEFAFEDMVNQEVDKFNYRWVVDQPCPDGRQFCHVIDRFPKYQSGYTGQRVWLDTAHLRIQQVHYFDRRNAHLKTMVASAHQLHNGKYWRASRMVMTNLITGKSTELLWRDFRFGVGLRSSELSVNALKNLR